jgi:hypothetical protein
MRIGEFGAARRELDGDKDDFGFYGETFVVEQRLPAILVLQLGASVSGKIDETEGFAAIWEAMRTALTIPAHARPARDGEEPDDVITGLVGVEEDDEPFRKFYKLAVDNGCELNDLMRLVMALFEAQTGRPTRPASASPVGSSTISPSLNTSPTPAAQPAMARLRSVDDLVRGVLRDGQTSETDPNANLVQMGDGQLVEYTPDRPAQTG